MLPALNCDAEFARSRSRICILWAKRTPHRESVEPSPIHPNDAMKVQACTGGNAPRHERETKRDVPKLCRASPPDAPPWPAIMRSARSPLWELPQKAVRLYIENTLQLRKTVVLQSSPLWRASGGLLGWADPVL